MPDMKGQKVRVEARLDGSIALRFEGVYLDISASLSPQQQLKPAPGCKPVPKDHNRGGRSGWMRDYPVMAPQPIWQAIRQSNRNN